MVPANESFYQVSTPNADSSKKRRISASMVPDRLSVIPPLFEKSFIQDDSSDFEVSLGHIMICFLLLCYNRYLKIIVKKLVVKVQLPIDLTALRWTNALSL